MVNVSYLCRYWLRQPQFAHEILLGTVVDWVLYGKILKALVDVLNQVALLCFSLAFGERAAEELLDDVGDVFPDLDAAAISDSECVFFSLLPLVVIDENAALHMIMSQYGLQV